MDVTKSPVVTERRKCGTMSLALAMFSAWW